MQSVTNFSAKMAQFTIYWKKMLLQMLMTDVLKPKTCRKYVESIQGRSTEHSFQVNSLEFY